MSLLELRHTAPSSTEWLSPDTRMTSYASQLVDLADVEDIVENWETAVEKRLAALTKLKKGWDGYGAAAVNPLVTGFALAVLQSVMSPTVPAPSIVPTHGGGIQLEWHTGGLDIELMIYRPFDAELSVEFDDDRDPIEGEPLTSNFGLLSEVLEEIA